MRGMWNHFDSQRGVLAHFLIRREWWFPWENLPGPLRAAAVDLGYNRSSWQSEDFATCGQRCLDMEEVEMMPEDDAVCVCSDSELIEGHDADNGARELRFEHMDTMDLLPQPSRRSYCQGPCAAYRPRGWNVVPRDSYEVAPSPWMELSEHSFRENWPRDIRAL